MKRISKLTALLLFLTLSATTVAGPPKSRGKSLGRSLSRGGSSFKSGGFSSPQKSFGGAGQRNTLTRGSNLRKSISPAPISLPNVGGIRNSIGGPKGRVGRWNTSPSIPTQTRIKLPNIRPNPGRPMLPGKIKLPTLPKDLSNIIRSGRPTKTTPILGPGLELPRPGKIPGIPGLPGKLPGFPGNAGNGPGELPSPNENPAQPGDRHDAHHRHPHHHRPICLPPIVNCRPPHVCPPCVTSVCPGAQVIVIEQSTEQILTDFLDEPLAEVVPAFVLELESNTEVSLEIDDLTSQPGALVLEVNGIGLPVEILLWQDGVLDIRVPSVGLGEAQLGKLYVLNGDLQLMAAVDARLHPARQ